MLSVVETLQLAIDSFNSIKAAIEAKGVNVGDTPKSEYNILISQIKADTSDLETQISSMQEQINSLSSQVYQLTSEKNSLSDQVDTLTSQNSTLQESLNSKDAEITSKTDTISTYTGYLNSIGTNIVAKGGTITEGDFSTYADGVNSIQVNGSSDITELQNQINELNASIESKDAEITSKTATISTYTGYLKSVGTNIVTKGGTITEDDFSTYADGVLSIPVTSGSDTTELQNQIDNLTVQVNNLTDDNNTLTEQVTTLTDENNTLTEQVSTLTGANENLSNTVDQYVIYFADIENAIVAKGSSVTHGDYSTYAQGVSNIDITTNSGGSSSSTSNIGIDQFKTQLTGLDFDTNDVIKITNANSLFSGCSKLEQLYGDPYLDLSNCDDVTDMFKGCSSFRSGLIIKNFGNNVQKDLILDLSECHSIDLDNFKDIIAKYTGTYVRKIILDPVSYSNNVGWGGVAKLKSKGIQVVSA